MNMFNNIKDQEITDITKSLLQSAESIYQELKSGDSLTTLKTTNASNDEQMELDVFADQCFLSNIKKHTRCQIYLIRRKTGYD